MIYINNTPVRFIHFMDGTQGCLDFKFDTSDASGKPLERFVVDWRYENDEELATLIFITGHIREVYSSDIKLDLRMYYVPNGRMDRVKHSDEVFTLKHFCSVINWLHFDKVYILDPHSNVTPALLERVECLDVSRYIHHAIIGTYNICQQLKNVEDVILFFPDEGAKKRYYTDEFKNHVCFYGSKVRDWKTGKIQGLKIESDTNMNLAALKDSTVLIIDDIISGGGTVYHSIQKLREYGISDVCVYCTHLENTMFMTDQNDLRQMLMGEDKTEFVRLFATDSIHHNGQFRAMTSANKGKVQIFQI